MIGRTNTSNWFSHYNIVIIGYLNVLRDLLGIKVNSIKLFSFICIYLNWKYNRCGNVNLCEALYFRYYFLLLWTDYVEYRICFITMVSWYKLCCSSCNNFVALSLFLRWEIVMIIPCFFVLKWESKLKETICNFCYPFVNGHCSVPLIISYVASTLTIAHLFFGLFCYSNHSHCAVWRFITKQYWILIKAMSINQV